MPKLSMILYKVGKTINLAKQSSYQIPRKPPLNTLIFEKLPEAARCGDKVCCGIKNPPLTKPVRICTKEEMQAFYCPPPPCDCRVKPQPMSYSQRMLKSSMLLTKAVFVGGLVYYTWSEGLWSDTEHSSLLYDKLTEKLCKGIVKALVVSGLIYFTYKEGLWSDGFKSSCIIGQFVERCPPEEDEEAFNEFADITLIEVVEPEPCYPFIPSTSMILYTMGQLWNKWVVFAFWLIMDAPFELYNKLTDKKKKEKKEKPPEECVT